MTKSELKTVSEIKDQIDSAKGMLEEMIDSFNEKFDEMSEDSQESEKGQTLQEEIGYLEDALSNLDAAFEDLGNII